MSSLLILPIELKVEIWALTLVSRRIHVLHDGCTYCCKQDKDICAELEHCHDHHNAMDHRRDHGGAKYATSLSRVCRQLYLELQPVIYEQLSLSFNSARVFTASVLVDHHHFHHPYPFVALLSNVHIDMGPARYASLETTQSNCLALKVLAEKGTRLCVLKLSFLHYYGAGSDLVLVDERILRAVLRFQTLSILQLQIGDVPPGPVADREQNASIGSVTFRMRCLEQTLKEYVCRPESLKSGGSALATPAAREVPTGAMIKDEVTLIAHTN